MATDDDDTRSVLASLRALPAERAADEAAELAAGHESHAAQAVRAIAILEDRRAWSVEDRRALGLPSSVGADRWLAAVRGRLAELDPGAVLDAWFDVVAAGEGCRTVPVAAEALGRVTTIAPLAERLRSILRDSPEETVRGARDALVASQVPIDATLLRLVRGLLVDPASSRETATAAIVVAGELARREPAAAAMIAERVRADRPQWRMDVYRPPSATGRTVDSEAAARAVERSGCASLAATALLELEERGSADSRWATALVAVAGDDGRAHLARMRGRPRWSGLSPPPAPHAVGLDALVSPIADVRRSALDAMAAAPRPEHLRALLLGTELDRHVVRDVLRLQWTRSQPTEWLSILSAHDAATRLDRRLAGIPRGLDEFVDAVAATRAVHLLLELIDTGAARSPMSIAQELTPALRELEANGAAAFAAWHIPDPRLTAAELASLDNAEAELAASAARSWG
jgi:hypothetical protein